MKTVEESQWLLLQDLGRWEQEVSQCSPARTLGPLFHVQRAASLVSSPPRRAVRRARVRSLPPAAARSLAGGSESQTKANGTSFREPRLSRVLAKSAPRQHDSFDLRKRNHEYSPYLSAGNSACPNKPIEVQRVGPKRLRRLVDRHGATRTDVPRVFLRADPQSHCRALGPNTWRIPDHLYAGTSANGPALDKLV